MRVLEQRLFLLAEAGNSKKIKELIDQGADIHQKDHDGWTAFMHAISKNNFNSAKVFLDHGANVDETDRYGTTPLIYVAEYGNTEVIKSLLDYGANPDHKNCHGLTAMKMAMDKKHDETYSLLKAASESKKLMSSIQSNNDNNQIMF